MKVKQPKHNRKKEPKISEDEMIRLYKSGLALREVGEIAGISRQAVQVRLKRNGFARRSQTVTELVKKSDPASRSIAKELLDRLYTAERKSPKTIASLIGISHWAVRENLKHNQIAIRRKRLRGLDGRVVLTKNLLERLYLKEHFTVREIAEQTNYTQAWVGRLLARFGFFKDKR
jgi:predicted DNA-binding protein YlxM (UPF0122 family)